jgi:hypothetical protein
MPEITAYGTTSLLLATSDCTHKIEELLCPASVEESKNNDSGATDHICVRTVRQIQQTNSNTASRN